MISAQPFTRNWGALLLLALFLAVGLAVLDDYGLNADEVEQREIAVANLSYLTGEEGGSLPSGHNKFYGITFELPFALVDRALGLEDTRSSWLIHHLGVHLFFLTGGFFAYLLARRLMANRLLALFAMLLYLLHPVLYGHSFYNSKDIPFSTMFIITLFLMHRAFRRETLLVFVLLGAAAGALVNLRIMGFILIAAVPALRALDFAFAPGWQARKRILITTGAFALASWLAVYALLPYLWRNPASRVIEWWSTLANHPVVNVELFQGVFRRSVEFPPEYIPVWISITTPPFALFLGLIGGGALLINGMKAPGAGLRNTRLRFGLVLTGCFALPILAIAALDFNTLDRWRHVLFLWGPFSMLAALGARWLTSAARSLRLRRAALIALGAGLAATLTMMASLHPNEQAYFNFLTDRVTPNYLRTQYPIDYWTHPMRQAVELLLEADASPAIAADASSGRGMISLITQMRILPKAQRERITTRYADPDAVAFLHWPTPESGEALHRIQVFGNTALSIERKDDLRAAYETSLSREPLLRSAFDVHYSNGALIYVKEPCERRATVASFKLWVIPTDAGDVHEWRMPFGYEDLSFNFRAYGGAFDGKCVASVPLPDRPIARIRTGQTNADGALWESTAVLNADAAHAAWREAAAGERVARSVYDVYRTNGDLVYVKEPCGPSDTEDRFFLHIMPERVSDLPKERRRVGFDNLDFDFFLHGAWFEGKCAARVALPSYPIAGVRTGQRLSGAGEVWRVEAAFGDG